MVTTTIGCCLNDIGEVIEDRGHIMLYSEAKKRAVGILLEAGIDEAGVDAEYLLQKAAGVDRSTLFMMFSETIPEAVESKYNELIDRRRLHEPLQYILGNQEFMGYTFLVTPDVLIPRFDTEILAEQSIKRAKELLRELSCDCLGTYNFRYLDLCTGSGCVAVSVGIETGKYIADHKCNNDRLQKIPGRLFDGDFFLEVIGADISDAALDIAQKNWKLNIEKRGIFERNRLNGSQGTDNFSENVSLAEEDDPKKSLFSLKGSFIKSDLFNDIKGKFNLITANPPYIVKDEICTLMPEIKEHEPYLALDGGTDGMDFYRRICSEAPEHLMSGGKILMEFDDLEAEPVAKMMEDAGFRNIQIRKDLAGLRRVIEGTL